MWELAANEMSYICWWTENKPIKFAALHWQRIDRNQNALQQI